MSGVTTLRALGVLVVGALVAGVALAGPPRTVAVYPTVTTDGARADAERHRVDVQDITRGMEEAIRAGSSFSVFERSPQVMQSSVLREQDLSISGRARGEAAAWGKLANVGLVVQPVVTELRLVTTTTASEEFPGRTRVVESGHLAVTFKVLDTSTAEVRFQTSQRVSGSRDRSGGGGQQAGSGLFPEMARTAAVKGARAMIDHFFPLTVVRAEGQSLFVNRGQAGGMAVGALYDVYAPGKELVDPVTRKSLGTAERRIGTVRITRVTPEFSVAEPVGELTEAPRAGAVLRELSGGGEVGQR